MKFKIGDRVICKDALSWGLGNVIGYDRYDIDGTCCVEFDKNIDWHDGNCRVADEHNRPLPNGKDGHCYFVYNQNLKLENLDNTQKLYK